MDDRTCKWDGCDKPWLGQGFCGNHYQQARRLGTIKKLPLGAHALTDIDPERRTATCRTCGPGAALVKANADSFTCRTRAHEVRREHRAKNREHLLQYHREYGRAYKYGMKVADLSAILDADDLSCDICDKPLTVKKARVDHDHACCSGRGRTCGQCFRGILCNSCNAGLGLLGDDVERMRAAIEYIQSRGAPHRLRRISPTD